MLSTYAAQRIRRSSQQKIMMMKRSRNLFSAHRTLSLTLLVALTFLGSQTGRAADYFWKGGGLDHDHDDTTSDWHMTGNWSSSGFPGGAGDHAIFNDSTANAAEIKNHKTTKIEGLDLDWTNTLRIDHGHGKLVVTNTIVNQSAMIDVQTGSTDFSTQNLHIAAGTLSFSHAVPLNIVGRLSGVGMINDPADKKLANSTITVSGTHSPGGTSTLGGSYTPGIGTQTFSSTTTLNYAAGSIFEWNLNADKPDPVNPVNAGTYDKVVANKAVTGTSVFNVALGTNSFADTFWSTNKTWTDIFSGTGSYDISSVFTSLAVEGVSSSGLVRGHGYNGLFQIQGNNLTWSTTGAYEAVPEPGSALAGLLLAAGLLRRKRA